MNDSSHLSQPVAHICVVGAGISGLRCAAILVANGIKVTIFEARDRIGGRVCQSNKLGYPIDLGPQWIHTSGANPLLEIARKINVPLHSWNDKINLFDSEGHLVDDAKSNRISDLRWKIIAEAFEFSMQNNSKINKSMSLYDFFLSKVEEMKLDSKDTTLLLGVAEMWGDYVGDPIQKQSLKFAWMEECCGGEELIITSTFADIFRELTKLSTPVTKLELNKEVVNIVSFGDDTENANVSVTTCDGKKQYFDGVVVTAPLGWLKRNQKAFYPRLQERLLRAIDSISVGHLEKVYITFPTAFWMATNDVNEFPGYMNWIAPTYACDTNPNRWPQEAYNLAAFAAPNSHPTLLFYMYGDQSAYITALVDGMSEEDHYKTLNNFFRPYYSRLLHYDESSPGCKPAAILSTAWYRDEFAGYGSYCNFQVGIEEAASDVEVIRYGMPERYIWFAGEHCAPFEELGTATGAYLSGENTGKRVVDQFNRAFAGEKAS